MWTSDLIDHQPDVVPVPVPVDPTPTAEPTAETEDGCDTRCSCGYSYVSKDMDGTGKKFIYPGKGVKNCAAACKEREGCTGFEYNVGGNEGYKCGTYTGGASNLGKVRATTGQHSTWDSCVLNEDEGEPVEEGDAKPEHDNTEEEEEEEEEEPEEEPEEEGSSLTPKPTAETTEEPSDKIEDGAVYRFVNAASGRALFGQKKKQGEDGVGASPNGADKVFQDSKWLVQKQSDGSYQLVNAVTHRTLYAQSFKSSWEAGVGAYTGSSGAPDASWNFEEQAKGSWRIINAASGRALFAQKFAGNWEKGLGASPPGSKVYADSKWNLIKMASPTSEPTSEISGI